MFKHALTAVALAAALFVSANAWSAESPPTLPGAKTVSPQEAKALIDSGAQVYDVRKKASYVEGRLPKAKSVGSSVDAEAKTADVSVFGSNKAAALVIYGHGSDGWSAVYAVESAVKAGFTNVNWMRVGYRDWAAASLPIEK